MYDVSHTQVKINVLKYQYIVASLNGMSNWSFGLNKGIMFPNVEL